MHADFVAIVYQYVIYVRNMFMHASGGCSWINPQTLAHVYTYTKPRIMYHRMNPINLN